MRYLLSERAARWLARQMKDASVAVPADVGPTIKTRPNVPVLSQKDTGAFAIKYVDGVLTITNGVFMFGRCGNPIEVADKAVTVKGVYSVKVNNYTPNAATWTVTEDIPASTEFITYIPIVSYENDGEAEEGETQKIKLLKDYRRMPYIPVFDRGV